MEFTPVGAFAERILSDKLFLDLFETAKECGVSRAYLLHQLNDAFGIPYDTLCRTFGISKSTVSAAIKFVNSGGIGDIPTKPKKIEVALHTLPPEIQATLPGNCTGYAVSVELSQSEMKWLLGRFVKHSIREKLLDAYAKFRQLHS